MLFSTILVYYNRWHLSTKWVVTTNVFCKDFARGFCHVQLAKSNVNAGKQKGGFCAENAHVSKKAKTLLVIAKILQLW